MPEHFTLRSLNSLDHYVHLLRGNRRRDTAVIDQRELGYLALRLYEDHLMDPILFTQAAVNMGWTCHVYNGVPQVQGPGFIYRLRDGDNDLVAALCRWSVTITDLGRKRPWRARIMTWQFRCRIWANAQRFRRSLK